MHLRNYNCVPGWKVAVKLGKYCVNVWYLSLSIIFVRFYLPCPYMLRTYVYIARHTKTLVETMKWFLSPSENSDSLIYNQVAEIISANMYLNSGQRRHTLYLTYLLWGSIKLKNRFDFKFRCGQDDFSQNYNEVKTSITKLWRQ